MDSISSPKNSMRTGPRLFGREDIENAAADGILADHFDRIAAFVADAFEVLGEIVERDFIFDAQGLGELAVVWRGFGAREGRGDGRERDASVAVGQLAERGGARGQNLGVRRHVLAGSTSSAGRRDRRIAGLDEIGKCLQQREQRFGLLVAVDHDQLRAARGAMQQHGIESFRGEGEAGQPKRQRAASAEGDHAAARAWNDAAVRVRSESRLSI